MASTSGPRFTKYLTTILRLSYDSAKVALDLYDGGLIYRTSYEERRIFLQNRKIIGDSVCIFAYDIPKRNLNALLVTNRKSTL